MPFAFDLNKKYTYGDYLNWPDDIRCELIAGVIYDMTPAPMRKHQDILRDISVQFVNFLKNKRCKVYIAPFDVRLPGGMEKDELVDTVVQPDISIICDKKKLDEKGCRGAPDIVVEIISPSTASKDMKEKLNLYEKHGVKEYWIVHPDEKIVMVFSQTGKRGFGKPQVYSENDIIKVKRFKGLSINLTDVFEAVK